MQSCRALLQQSLSDLHWRPKGDFENERLVMGVLFLPAERWNPGNPQEPPVILLESR